MTKQIKETKQHIINLNKINEVEEGRETDFEKSITLILNNQLVIMELLQLNLKYPKHLIKLIK